MLTNLLKYEFMKKWKSMKYILLGYALIQAILLVISKILLERSNISSLFIDGSTKDNSVGFPLVMSMVFYFIFAFIIGIFPFFDGVTKYEKELSGKQAPLELMIPSSSWKKILSKLVTTLCVTIVCGIIIAASIMIFLLVMSGFDKNVMIAFSSFFREILEHPLSFLFTVIYGLFSYASFFLLVYLCTTIAKAITHKNKLSTLISIITFGVLLAIILYLSLQVEKYPIMTFTLFRSIGSGLELGLTTIIFDITVLVLTFLGTSYIMEKRIEY